MIVKYLVVYQSQEVAPPFLNYVEAWHLVTEKGGVREGQLKENWRIERVAG